MDSHLERRPAVTELLTDRYQLTMAYSYFKQGKHDTQAVFDAYFRKCPFKGEFAIFGGLESVIGTISKFKFTQDELDYLKEDLGKDDKDFFEYLASLSGSQAKVYAIKEGTLVFPN